MSSIKAIAVKNQKRDVMQILDNAQITVADGILGDFRGAQQGRQITILSESAWQKVCTEVDADLPWTTRRANLLVDGVEFDASWVGKTIRIGRVELVVTRETSPCSLMDEQHQGLTAALIPEWRGGVCCNVLKAGYIKVGDSVKLA